jgi:ADP-heptose:LPS heptosyltransferase
MRIDPLEWFLYLSLRTLKFFDRRRTEIKYFRPEHVRNILVVSSTAIGDTLLSTPAIRAVRERYPQAKIIGHFHIRYWELFASNPHIDGIIPFYGGYRKFLKTIGELRKQKFDLILILHGNDPESTTMAYLSGAPFIVKLPNTTKFRFLLSNPRPILRWEDFSHGVEQRLRVAGMVGGDPRIRKMVMPITGKVESAVDFFLNTNGIGCSDLLIGFQVGASGVYRMWFAERFIELGKKLVESYPSIWIILTGSPQEKIYCQKIAQGIGERAIVSAAQIPLKGLPFLIKRLKLLVTGDTGTMHLAVAVGTPVVALFAVTDARKSGPYYEKERHFIIQKGRTCDPCLSKKCPYPKCMANITVDEVFQAIWQQMKLGEIQ